MVRKRFLLITMLVVLCVAIVTGTAGASATHNVAAKAASPSDIVQDNVYLITSDTSLTALNASTGALLWQFQPGGYVDPPHVVNHIVYVLALSSGFYALNETTGATLWMFHPSGFLNTPVFNNAVYMTVDSATSNSTTLYALNPKTGATLWSFQPGVTLGTPVIAQNVVYIGTYASGIYALSATNGKLLWHSQSSTYSFSLGPVVNGIVYSGAEGPKYSFGELWAFSTRNGALLWNFVGALWAEGHSTTYVEGGTVADPLICALKDSNGAQIWCTPGYEVRLMDGQVYVTTGPSSFSVYSDSNGALLWSSSNTSFITEAAGVVYAAGNNSVEALKASNGSLLWSHTNASFLTVTSGVVYAVDTSNFVEALKASNGSLLWHSSTTYGVGMYFSVVNGLITATSADNLSVYALKATNGKLQWRYQLPNTLSSVSIVNGIVYAITLNGTIYALRASDGTLLWQLSSFSRCIDGFPHLRSVRCSSQSGSRSDQRTLVS